jgi:hypothetical protein
MRLAGKTREQLIAIATRLGVLVFRHDSLLDIKKKIQKAERAKNR